MIQRVRLFLELFARYVERAVPNMYLIHDVSKSSQIQL